MSDLTLSVNSVERDDGDTINITEGTQLDFECVISNIVSPVTTVLWDIDGITSNGTTVTRIIYEDTTATCSASNDASPYTGGIVSKQVTITVARKLALVGVKK